jgi:hypothetical protein
VYGAVPPVADTVTEVVPPKHEIAGAVDEAVGKALTTTALAALEMELQALPNALTSA